MPMALSAMLLYTRQLYADTDTTNIGLSDAQLTRFLNENYIRLRDTFSPRWQWVNSNGLNGAVAAGGKSISIQSTTIAEIKQLFVESGANRATDKKGTPMTRDEIGRVLTLQKSETTQAKPRIYALQRVGSTDPASIGYWIAYIWPISNTDYGISGMIRSEVTELSGATDKPDVQDGEAYTICRLAAADAALITGRPLELVQSILGPVDEKLKSHLTVAVRSIRNATIQPSEAS